MYKCDIVQPEEHWWWSIQPWISCSRNYTSRISIDVSSHLRFEFFLFALFFFLFSIQCALFCSIELFCWWPSLFSSFQHIFSFIYAFILLCVVCPFFMLKSASDFHAPFIHNFHLSSRYMENVKIKN